ncbi:hypothetical protein ETC04_11905 [Geobacillus sp. MR]|nr:hypothetical protein [Geobacillus sp. MR]
MSSFLYLRLITSKPLAKANRHSSPVYSLGYRPSHSLRWETSVGNYVKNALDWAREAWNNKAAGIVSDGSTGVAHAAEHLRGICGELKIVDVRTHPTLSLFTDFENGTVFKPQAFQVEQVNVMLDELLLWSVKNCKIK